MEINYYQLDAMKASNIRKKTETMLEEGAAVLKGCAEESAQQKMLLLLSSPAVKELLVAMSRLPVFSHEFGLAFKDSLGCLSWVSSQNSLFPRKDVRFSWCRMTSPCSQY